MKPGDLVELCWLDSGLRLMDSSEGEARDAGLAEVTLWGRVVYHDEEVTVLAQEVDDSGQGQYGVVWTPCIRAVRYLSETPDLDDTIDRIVSEVESEERPALPPTQSTWDIADELSKAEARRRDQDFEENGWV